MNILNELPRVKTIQLQNQETKNTNKNKDIKNDLSLVFLKSPASCYYFYLNYINNEPYQFEPIFSKLFIINNIVYSYITNYKILLIPYYITDMQYIKIYVSYMNMYFEFSNLANYRYNKIQKLNLELKNLIDQDLLDKFTIESIPRVEKLPYIKTHLCKENICPYYHICRYKNKI